MPTLTLVPSCDHLNDTGMALQESCSVKGVCLSKSWRGLGWFASVGGGHWTAAILSSPCAPLPGMGRGSGVVVNLYLDSSHKKHGCHVHIVQKTQEIRNLTYFSK